MHLSMEIYDHVRLSRRYNEISTNSSLQIVYYFWNEHGGEASWEEDARHHRPIRSNCRRDIAALRLVNRDFCLSASRQLFRHIGAMFTPFWDTSPLERLTKIPKSPYAMYVRRIDFGFQWKISAKNSGDALHIEELAGTLPSLLVRFPNLGGLDFHPPPLHLPQDQRELFMQTVVRVLRYVPLPTLTELVVKFPITHDFGRLFPSRISPLANLSEI